MIDCSPQKKHLGMRRHNIYKSDKKPCEELVLSFLCYTLLTQQTGVIAVLAQLDNFIPLLTINLNFFNKMS
jgi:hypothetical protein